MDKRHLVTATVTLCVCALFCWPLGLASTQQRPKTESGSGSDNLTVHVPDVVVFDQDGNKVHFYSDLVKGKTVAINFAFTTSTTIGPPLIATFARVQKDLAAQSRQDIRLITVTVDPVTDTPQTMKAFAAKFQAQPGWTFVTGDQKDIDNLLRALGAFVEDKEDATPMVLIGNDAARYWTRAYGLSSPTRLVEAILGVAGRK